MTVKRSGLIHGIGRAILLTAIMGHHLMDCNAQEQKQKRVQVQGAFVSIRDKAELPALEQGNLTELKVQPGSQVTTGQELGSLDDREATLALEVAQLDLQIAERKSMESKGVEIAEASLTESPSTAGSGQRRSQHWRAGCGRRHRDPAGKKEEELALERLERARKSREFSKISVSDQEWLTLQNEFDRKQITTRKSTIDQTVAQMKARSKSALLAHQQTSVSRLEFELLEAKSARELEKLELMSLKRAVSIAEARLERRRLRAPFDGLVVEQKKHKGEWVEPGEAVFRLIGLDRLYVEGFIDRTAARDLRPGAGCNRDGGS